MAKVILSLGLVLSLLWGLDKTLHKKSGRSLSSKLETRETFPYLTERWTEDINPLFEQTFSYLKKGCQSHVYVSDDQKYVLKFFKQHIYEPRSFLERIPFLPQGKRLLEKKKELNDALQSCAIAFRNFKEETALLYVHLTPTNCLKQKVVLRDKRGKEHMIDLDKTLFIVQKRAALLYPHISELINKGDERGAKETIRSLFSLLESLGKRGVVDNDPILRKNFGFIGNRAVQIDIGSLHIDPSRIDTDHYKYDLHNITLNLRVWLQKNQPQLLPFFDEQLHSKTLIVNDKH